VEGTLYGVGIGPGDAELVTLKAVRIINECGIIAVPKSGDGEKLALNIARKAVPNIDCKTIIALDMPMTRDSELLHKSHLKAAESVISYLKEGISVAFLTLGDPTVYSTYIYLHRIVREKGYKTEIIPGVPSFCAVSAKLNDCLVESSQSLHIIPGSYNGLEEGLKLPGTRVLMKCGKAFPQVRRLLFEMELDRKTKMVENCGLENERIYIDISEADEKAGYFSVIVIKGENQNEV
jgi:precorrin-2/cobalt-factor-2 C20-methyltransferase